MIYTLLGAAKEWLAGLSAGGPTVDLEAERKKVRPRCRGGVGWGGKGFHVQEVARAAAEARMMWGGVGWGGVGWGGVGWGGVGWGGVGWGGVVI